MDDISLTPSELTGLLPYLQPHERAELEQLLNTPAFPLFGPWLEAASPLMTWSWRHLRYIQAHLDRVTSGEITRLILCVPPRHGKSECTTVRYPAYRIEKDPATRVIVGAYSATLAKKFSRKIRKFAGRFTISPERRAVDDWETPQGGGLRAVGVGGGVTGMGANLIVIDDPVKSRKEANSETYREAVWDWYKDDIYTRLEPGGAIIVIMTRWHEDDLVGRLLREQAEGGEQWTVINLPAEAEEHDPLGRKPGEALCPERYDETALARIKRLLKLSYYALFQQRPQPADGGMFKRPWFAIVGALPVGCQFVRYWDKAGTDGGGDYTAGVLLARALDGSYYIVDVVRGQWSAGERDKIIVQTAALDQQRYGRVKVWGEQEPGSAGKDSAAAFVTMLAGYAVETEPASGDKALRAEPLAAQAEVGNVRLLAGPWNAAYLDELCAFPFGKHDDQVDGSSGAFNKLALGLPSGAALVDFG